MNNIFLGRRKIGSNYPIYIIADIGLTNGGDVSRAKELINISKENQ